MLSSQNKLKELIFRLGEKNINNLMFQFQQSEEEEYPFFIEMIKVIKNNDQDFDFINKQFDLVSSRKNIEPKKIKTITIDNIENLTKEDFFKYTLNLKTPCLFKSKKKITNKEKLKQSILLDNNDLLIYDIKNDSYEHSTKFNKDKHNIFNSSLSKQVTKNFIPNLNDYLFGGNLFLSKMGSFTAMHNEIEQFINLQVEGKKKWILVDPQDSELVMPLKSTNVLNYYSILSLNKNIFQKLIVKVPRYEIIVEEGDFLFVPSWYWHSVESLTNSFSISLRYIHLDSIFHKLFFPKNILFVNVLKSVDPRSFPDLSKKKGKKNIYIEFLLYISNVKEGINNSKKMYYNQIINRILSNYNNKIIKEIL